MANKEILIFAQLFFVAAVGGALIQRPLNEATSVGGQTVFNCSSDTTGAITWLYTTNCNTAGGTVLTTNNCDIISSYASHYRIEKPGEFVCNLIVFNASLSLGGCYACADGFGTGRQYQAMLIVVDSNVNTTTNSTDLISGEDVVISTSVSYGGPSIPLQPPPLPPSFYWTLQSDPNQNITSYQGSTTNTSASSYIVVKAQKPDVPSYLCNLFFNPPIYVPPSCASNAPTYRTSWVTPTYSVSYPPQNLIISGPPNPCLYEPVELICSASGYPPPTYKWFNFSSGNVLTESNTVTIDRGGSYQCVASNTIRNVLHNASTVVNVSDCQSPQNVSITASNGPCAGSPDSCGKLNSDSLTCEASGFPEPEYEWSYPGGKDAGPTVVARDNIVYQCTATNHYADQPHSASSTLQVYWLFNLGDTKSGSDRIRSNSYT